MKIDYTIAITTFSKRYNFATKLVEQIRNHTNNKIYLIINGEKDGDFDETYRKNILSLCTQYNYVYPVIFVETRGLAKMWNTALIFSGSDNVLMLNDDIEIHSDVIFRTTSNEICNPNYTGLTTLNHTFSHYIVNKVVVDKLGYFDERLIGFGEEDADMTYRFLKAGISIGNIMIGGVRNIVSNIRHDFVKPGVGKYSSFNRIFAYKEKFKEDPNGIVGMFHAPMEEVLQNEIQYPYESFFRKNKNNL